MNDPNKRIDVNLSSLLSLKAELLRKHDEVSKAKKTHLISDFVPNRSTVSKPKSKIDTDSKPTGTKSRTDEVENNELLDKSKKILLAKSKFYDKMTSSGGTMNSDDNCLVMFNRKKQSDSKSMISSDSEDETPIPNEWDDPNDEWVEYTDYLGRTRTCLKKDLEFFQKQNGMATNSQSDGKPKWTEDVQGDYSNRELLNMVPTKIGDPDTMSEFSKVSKIDEMRQNWEKKEQENLSRENIHYQDILYDEARTHGVGYYGFSTDDTERAKQQKELETLRQKTLDEQQKRDEQRLAREKIIAERVLAAKNRQRARLGLSPLEALETETSPTVEVKEPDKKVKEKESRKKRKERQLEMEREEERKNHLRPWDEGKGGVKIQNVKSDDWTYRPEREPMSQEQWNEQKRLERNRDFAPPTYPTTNNERPAKRVMKRNYTDGFLQPEERPERPFINRNTDDFVHSEERSERTFNKRNTDHFVPMEERSERTFIKRNYTDDSMESEDRSTGRSGAEIPPPPTFDYYGPTMGQHRSVPITQHLDASIEAGLRFLREQSDKDTLGTKRKWIAEAEY